MYQRSSINFAKLRLGLRIMPVLRYGKMSLMTINRIFGHLDAPFIKWLHFTLLLLVRTFKKFMNPSYKATLLLFLFTTQRNFKK